MSGLRPAVVLWREEIRDSGLDSSAKLVALVLSTYMDAGGACARRDAPSICTLAQGSGLGRRTVQVAIRRLEQDLFLHVKRSKGRSVHGYQLRSSCAVTVQGLHGWEGEPTAQQLRSNGASDDLNRASDDANRAAAAPEVVVVREESARGGADTASPFVASAREAQERKREREFIAELVEAFDAEEIDEAA